MRSVYSYMVYTMKLILMTFVLFMVMGGKSQAQGVWKDSLNVRVADSMVLKNQSGDHYLHFAIVVERVNKDWDNNDTILGDCDLYFDYNPEAFAGGASPEITWVNDSLWGGGKGSPHACYSVNSKIWADRLLIDITKRDNILNTYIYKLRLPHAQIDTLCKIRWKLRVDPGSGAMAARLGVAWDPAATGLQSSGGNPIIEGLQGDVIKNPLPFILLDWPEKLPVVCEGEAAEVGVTAETTGDDSMLSFVWFDSIAGGNWRRIDSVNTPTAIKTHTTSKFSYDYQFRGKGDTLYIPQVNRQMDSIFFRCLAVDASISASRWTDAMQLLIRDSIRGFLAPEDGSLTKNFVDTVTMCPGGAVPVRFYIYGTDTKDELVELDSVYFQYRIWSTPSITKFDTVGFSVRDRKILTGKKINGLPVFYWSYNVADTGQYYIENIWTKYCGNAAPDPVYDTLYIKTGSYQILEKLTLLVNRTSVVTDTVAVVFGANVPDIVYNTRIGHTGAIDPVYDPGDQYVWYRADSVGLDTIRYKYSTPGKCEWWRPIEVQDLKYISIKVLLEGPYMTSGTSAGKMRSLITTSNLNTSSLDTLKNFAKSYYISPYGGGDSIAVNQLRAMVLKVEQLGFQIADIIYVQLRERNTATGEAENYIASRWAFLRNDGVVCDTAGNPYIGFKNLPENNYYVVVKHRNHLGAMSANAILLKTQNPTVTMIDFTANMGDIMDNAPLNSLPPVKMLANGVLALYTGNTVKSSNNKAEIISSADISRITKDIKAGLPKGYYISDVDFTGYATSTDLIKPNLNNKSQFYEKF